MQNNNNGILAAFGIIAAVAVIAFLFWGFPQYGVYRQNLKGQANLRQQEWEKKISVEQAKAKLESAKLESDAEVARAKGAAEANRIIGDSLTNNEAYLRYLWINNIQAGDNAERIYIPTEAGMPILEARK